MSFRVQDIDDEFENDLNGDDDERFEDDDDEYDHWLVDQIEIKAKLITVKPNPIEEMKSWTQFKEGSLQVNEQTSMMMQEIRENEKILENFNGFSKATAELPITTPETAPSSSSLETTKPEFGKEYLSLSETDRTAISTSLKGLLSAVVAMLEVVPIVSTGEAGDEVVTDDGDIEQKESESSMRVRELEERLKVQQEAAHRMMESRKEFDQIIEKRQVVRKEVIEETKEKLSVESEEKKKQFESLIKARREQEKEAELREMAERRRIVRELEESAKENARLLAEREKAKKLYIQQVFAVEKLQVASKKWLFKTNLNKRISITIQKRKEMIAATTIQGCIRANIYRKNKRIIEEKKYMMKLALEEEEKRLRELEEERKKKELKFEKSERKKMEIEERKSKILEVQRKAEIEERRKREEIDRMRKKQIEQEKLKKEEERKALEKKIRSEEMEKMRIEEIKQKEMEAKQKAHKKRLEVKQKRRLSLEVWNQSEKQRSSQWEFDRQAKTHELENNLGFRRWVLGGRIEKSTHQNVETIDQGSDNNGDGGYIVLDALDCELSLFSDVDGSIARQKERRLEASKQSEDHTKEITNVSETTSAPCRSHADDPRAALRQQLAEAEERRARLLEALASSAATPTESSDTNEQRGGRATWQGPSRLDRALSSSAEVTSHLKKISGQHEMTTEITHCDDVVDEAAEQGVMDVVGYMGLGDLKRVVKLELDVEGIERGLSALSVMASLTSLSLSVNKISNLKESGLLSLNVATRRNRSSKKDVFPLRYLCLRDNRIRSLEGLGDAFAMSPNNNGDGLRDLLLDVNALDSIAPSHLNPLSGSLVSFSASANKIHSWPDGLKLLKLNKLDMSHNKLSYLPLSSLQGLPSLTHLDLGRNELTVASGHALSAAKCLTSLTLSRNKLKEPPFPLRLPLLRKLWLGSNRISSLKLWASSVRPSTSRPASMENPDRRHNTNHSEGVIEELASDAIWLPSLEYLSLENNAIRELSPGCFVGLPNLQSLDLVLNLLSSVSVFQFPCLEGLWVPHYSASNLIILNMKENSIADYLPEPLVDASRSSYSNPTPAPATESDPTPTDSNNNNDAPSQEATVITAQAAPHVAPVPDWESPLLSLLGAKLSSLKMVDGHLLGPTRKLLSGVTNELMNGRGAAIVQKFKRSNLLFNTSADTFDIEGMDIIEDFQGMNGEELAMMLDEYGVGSRVTARRNKRRRSDLLKSQDTSITVQKEDNEEEFLKQMWATRRWKCAYCGGSIQPREKVQDNTSGSLPNDLRCCAQCDSKHTMPPSPSLRLLNGICSEKFEEIHCCGCGSVDCSSACHYFGAIVAFQEASRELDRLQQRHIVEEEKDFKKSSQSKSNEDDELIPSWLDGSQATAWRLTNKKDRAVSELQKCLHHTLRVHSLELNDENETANIKWPGWCLQIEQNDNEEDLKKKRKQKEEIAKKMKKKKEASKKLVALFCQRIVRGWLVRRWWQAKGRKNLEAQHALRMESSSRIQSVWRGRRVRKQMATALASAAWVDPEVEVLLAGGGLGDMAAFLKQLDENHDSFDKTPILNKAWTNTSPSPQIVENLPSPYNLAHDLYGDFTAYDELGPSVSRQQSRLTSAASSEVSEVSLHSAHWGPAGRGTFSELPVSKPGHSSMRSSPIATTRSPSLPAISPGTLSARRKDEEAAKKVMDEWGLSNPDVAANVLHRQDHIKRAEKEAAQREKETDPVYRYHRLMRKVAQNNLDPDTTPRGTGRGNGPTSSTKKKSSSLPNTSGVGKGGGSGGGGWGTRASVAQDRARNIKKKKKNRNLTPAAWAMPPIDQKNS